MKCFTSKFHDVLLKNIFFYFFSPILCHLLYREALKNSCSRVEKLPLFGTRTTEYQDDKKTVGAYTCLSQRKDSFVQVLVTGTLGDFLKTS